MKVSINTKVVRFSQEILLACLFSSGCLLCVRACYSAAALADFVEMQCVKAGSGQIFLRYREQVCQAPNTKSFRECFTDSSDF